MGDKRRRLTAASVLTLLALAAYANSLTAPFIFDDLNGIVDNAHVRRLLPLSVSMSARPDTAAAGRPILSLTLALNYAIGGYNVLGYHVANLAIHLAAGLALYGVVRRTLAVCQVIPAAPLALTAAAIWVVHPLNTEAVTYVIKRNESLMAFFYLVTLYSAIRAAQAAGARAAAWQAAAVLACVLGMGVKETMATAPLIVFLHDLIFFGRGVGAVLRRRVFMYAGLAASWEWLAYLVAAAPRSVTTGFDLNALTPWTYLVTQAGVIAHYLRLAVWPVGQCLDYGWPAARSLIEVARPGAAVLSLLALTGVMLWRRPRLGYLGLSFFVTLAPSSSVVPIREIACEYRMYLPLTSLCVAVTLAGYGAAARLRSHSLYARAAPARVGCIAGGLVVLLLTATTIRRNYDYRSAEAIWSDTVRKAPHHARPHNLLANTLARAGKMEPAEREFRAALAIDPGYVPSMTGLANALAIGGRLDEAAAEHRRVLEIRPNYWPAHANLAALLLQMDQPDAALRSAARAAELESRAVAPRITAAEALAKLGRLDEARRWYEEAMFLDPAEPRARAGLRALSEPRP